MTNQKLKELKEICKAATPGPWGVVEDRIAVPILVGTEIDFDFFQVNSNDDAKFISKARTALPELIEHCEKQAEQIREMDNWFYKNLDCNWIAAKDSKFSFTDKIEKQAEVIEEIMIALDWAAGFIEGTVGKCTDNYVERALESAKQKLGEK